MSLIALTYNNDFPILIGDVLISSNSFGLLQDLPFSKISKNELPKDLKYLPSDLQQKIYVIADNLAIALAGSVFEMKVFLGEISNNFKYRDCSWENILSFIKEDSWRSEFQNSSLILLYCDAKIFNVYYHGRCEVAFSNRFKKIIAIGSGARSFISTAVENTVKYGNDLPLPQNITLSTQFLISEKDTMETIADYWGAGFEFIYWKDNKLQKLNSVAHVLISVFMDLHSGSWNKIINFIYNSNYIGNLLILSVLDTVKDEKKVFAVRPINMQLSEIDDSKMSSYFNLESANYCLTYIFNFSDGHTKNISYLVDEKIFFIREKPAENRIEMGILEEFENMLFTVIKEAKL